MINTSENRIKLVMFYYFIFIGILSVIEINVFYNMSNPNSIISIMFYILIVLSIWVVSCMLFIKLVLRELIVNYLKLDSSLLKGIRNGLIYSIPIIILYVPTNLLLGREISFDIPIFKVVGGIALVGIVEEPIFRGMILKEFKSRYNFWKANIITSLLFLFIHFPKWIIRGDFETMHVLSMCLSVIITSLYLGFTYKRNNSLWACITVHTLHNLIVSIFI